MPRPDPALLDSTRYPFRIAVGTRFDDMDINGHINNVAIMGLFQESRVRLHECYAGLPLSRPYAIIVASITFEFLRDGEYPRPMDVFIGITNVGRTSHALASLMVQDGQPVAFSTCVIVRTLDGGPIENDPAFRQALSPWQMTI
jgi:acyl-CoA thioester hydrolase